MAGGGEWCGGPGRQVQGAAKWMAKRILEVKKGLIFCAEHSLSHGDVTGNSANSYDYLKFKMPVRGGDRDNSPPPQHQKTSYATDIYISISAPVPITSGLYTFL